MNRIALAVAMGESSFAVGTVLVSGTLNALSPLCQVFRQAVGHARPAPQHVFHLMLQSLKSGQPLKPSQENDNAALETRNQ